MRMYIKYPISTKKFNTYIHTCVYVYEQNVELKISKDMAIYHIHCYKIQQKDVALYQHGFDSSVDTRRGRWPSAVGNHRRADIEPYRPIRILQQIDGTSV